MKFKLFTLLLALLVVAGCRNVDVYQDLEDELTEKAGEYYEQYMKNENSGVTNQKVFLGHIGYKIDISNFVEHNCDMEESYSVIIIEYEDGVQTGQYEVVNYLICDDYQSPTITE